MKNFRLALLFLLVVLLFSCGSSNQDIIIKISKEEKITKEEKIQFSKFINSEEGKLYILNLKKRVEKEIFDTLKQKTALSKIAKLEQKALDWKQLK
jgi:hypothetical protein